MRLSTTMGNPSSDRAYEHIRKQILNGGYPPGAPLLSNILSDEIGVSRTPIRDALRKLEADGLVNIRPRLGASVKTMDLKEFQEMNELRLSLEMGAVGYAAARRSNADLETMRTSLDALRAVIEKYILGYQGDPLPSELLREDIQFHIAIINAARNDLLKKEIFRLHLIHRVVVAPAVMLVDRGRGDQRTHPVTKHREVIAEHQEIYDAIVKRDPAAARKAMEAHLLNNIHTSPFTTSRPEASSAPRSMEEVDLAGS